MKDDIFDMAPYALDKKIKGKMLTQELLCLTEHHYENCLPYRGILDAVGFDIKKCGSYEDIPFLPVRLFKETELLSVDRSDVVKTMTSSGTSNQTVSKIFLDRYTASIQQKVLVKLVSDLIGPSRMPMIIIDCPSVLKNRDAFSARAAGILGFSIFASDRIFALDDDMDLNAAGIAAFLNKHQGKKILLFGFTFMIWQHFYKALKNADIAFDLSNGILIHGGGWKKLISASVPPEHFKTELSKVCGLREVHDYYGMVEQTGCIYIECEHGHLHASIFSDVLTRRHTDFSVCDFNEAGILQVCSLLPYSYPGHLLLTDDEGVILGEDDCPCGRLGKYFKLNGRLKNAEIRGCSDTYAAEIQ